MRAMLSAEIAVNSKGCFFFFFFSQPHATVIMRYPLPYHVIKIYFFFFTLLCINNIILSLLKLGKLREKMVFISMLRMIWRDIKCWARDGKYTIHDNKNRIKALPMYTPHYLDLVMALCAQC